MEEEARVEMSLENRFKEALRKAKEVREYIKERNDTRELDVAEWLAYDMRYVEEYVRQLENENNYYKTIFIEKEINENFEVLYEKTLKVVKTDYIPKSKVKEKIEEMDRIINSSENKQHIHTRTEAKIVKGELQELLREE